MGSTSTIIYLYFLVFICHQATNAFLARNCHVPQGRNSDDNESKVHQLQRKIVHRKSFSLCPARARGLGVESKSKRKESWFPTEYLLESERGSTEEASIRESLQLKALQYMATLLQGTNEIHESNTNAYELAKGKFTDLCCTIDGEELLEILFKNAPEAEERVIVGAIVSLQSLLILGTQYGVKATLEQFERSVSHLIDDDQMPKAFSDWDASSTRKLKYESRRTAGLELLATLQRKRTAQGAFQVLSKIGAWQRHEDLALLRSGFSIRFTEAEIEAAEKACLVSHDPDSLLNIRRDFRDQKVYTIDGASTTEIDDGLAVEVITKSGGSKRHRYWIHIADADRWAPRDSNVFELARKRATSLYLPHGSIPMLPSQISTNKMSLKANTDAFALSLGVELDGDGSIIDSSILVTSSKVRVSYRLTYDDVDEMIEDGIAYSEEWELGALYSAALLRREHRIRNGSAEAFVPTQIPQYSASTFTDKGALEDTGIALNIQVSHNGGKNQSSVSEDDKETLLSYASPVSAASMLVTEMMVLAGEAIGKWNIREEKTSDTLSENEGKILKNTLRLPFRSQPKPDYRSRMREKSIMEDLLSYNVGHGYCHAWFARRFLSPAEISEVSKPHSGLGIECYVQWTSPIRRFGDLQVHASTKRFLRRQKVLEMLKDGSELPSALTESDLGCDLAIFDQQINSLQSTESIFDSDIDYNDRSGFINTARILQRSSQRYWMLEYIRRLGTKKSFDALVLGCTNPERRQYAIYIYELGLEWRYISPVGSLQSGTIINIKVANALPHNGQCQFVRVQV